MRTATVQEAINGNNNDTVITPLRLKQVLSELDLSSGGGGSVGDETDPVFKSSPAAGITTSNIASWNTKQDPLVSGQNIKTINGQDILGEGDITIESGSSSDTPEVFIGASTPTSGEKVWFQTKGNLFNKNTMVDGGRLLSNGNVHTWNNDCCCSDYIEVKPNTQYTLSGGTQNSGATIKYYNCYYDENKNCISSFLVASGTQTITTPANAKYMRFTVYNVDKNKFQFEEGAVATAYKPYSDKQSINILSGTVYEEFLNVDELSNGGDVVVEESDPTVPAHVKAITQEDIDKWNSGTGGGGTGGSDYELPVATGETLGGIKIGSNLHITEDGVLSAISDEITGDGSFDPVPINSIFDYDGDTVPEGFVEVSGGYEVKEYDITQYINPELTDVKILRSRCVNKFDRIVMDFVITNINIPTATIFTLFILPDELMPPQSVEFTPAADNGNTKINGIGWVNKNGNKLCVNLGNTLPTSGYLRACVVYDL